MKKQLVIAILLFCTYIALAQLSAPPPVGAYINPGSGWTPMTSGGSGAALGTTPPPSAIYVFSGGHWIPWTGSAGGGAPTTCTNTNNYPCLNTANVFTTTQNIQPASGNAYLGLQGSSSSQWYISGHSDSGDIDIWDNTTNVVPFAIHHNSGPAFYAIETISGGCFGWSAQGTFPSGTSPDTCMWRPSAGVIDFGVGVANDVTATLNAGNATLGGAPVVTMEGTPTVGNVACWKTVAGVRSLGQCTSVVGAGGACTCS